MSNTNQDKKAEAIVCTNESKVDSKNESKVDSKKIFAVIAVPSEKRLENIETVLRGVKEKIVDTHPTISVDEIATTTLMAYVDRLHFVAFLSKPDRDVTFTQECLRHLTNIVGD